MSQALLTGEYRSKKGGESGATERRVNWRAAVEQDGKVHYGRLTLISRNYVEMMVPHNLSKNSAMLFIQMPMADDSVRVVDIEVKVRSSSLTTWDNQSNFRARMEFSKFNDRSDRIMHDFFKHNLPED